MRLIDKNITDIVAGYDDILKAENELRNHWRMALLSTYARRKLAAEVDAIRLNRWQLRALIAFLLGIGFTFVGIGLSCRGIIQNEANILWYGCGGSLLTLLGLLVLLASWLSQRTRQNPTKTSQKRPGSE